MNGTESAILDQLRFEVLLLEITAMFVGSVADDFVPHLERALRRMANHLGAERGTLLEFRPDGSPLVVADAWVRPLHDPGDPEPIALNLAQVSERLRNGERIVIRHLDDDRDNAVTRDTTAILGALGVRSYLALPLRTGGRVLGAISLAAYAAECAWPDSTLPRLDFLGQVFADALAHQRAEERLRESEERYRSLLSSMAEGVILQAADGRILASNASAERILGLASDALSDRPLIDPCWRMVREDGTPLPDAEFPATVTLRTGEPCSNVLIGVRKPDETQTWISVSTQPLAHAGTAMGSAVVLTFSDVTEHKRIDDRLRGALHEVASLRDRLEHENVFLKEEIQRRYGFTEIVGDSIALKRVLYQVEQVAATGSTVLLLGETGTGKEVVARALHERSGRRARTLVTVNCAALPGTLVESELFGYEKGAFTGAATRTLGRFEIADGGSLFLDEIGDVPLESQAKLLRVLQDGTFERLGSSRPITVDVRVIAATNRQLEREVLAGRFRADLYYRLSVFPIALPPLRERVDDIPLLVRYFIARKQDRFGKRIERIPESVMKALQAYSWPGNVRELENVIERALILCQGSTLHVDESMLTRHMGTLRIQRHGSLEEIERAHILDVLSACDWKIAGKGHAAERLGLKRSTLQFRMRKLGIERPEMRRE